MRYDNITTAYILEYQIIKNNTYVEYFYKSNLKINNFEIIKKSNKNSATELKKKLLNKLKRIGITAKEYYINVWCNEHELKNYTITIDIAEEYIINFCNSFTIPKKYTIVFDCFAYTIQHGLLLLQLSKYGIRQSDTVYNSITINERINNHD